MKQCFVIQPFDNAEFDHRYDDVLSPAIKAAGANPYRVDRDPSTEVPIEQIEKEIRNSAICVADITLDNPNVWFELGYAISAKKRVVLICGDTRNLKFPFDVQHRKILTYKTTSKRDFEALESSLSEIILESLNKLELLARTADEQSTVVNDGLEQHEILAIASICSNIDNPDDAASVFSVQQDMELGLFNKLATTLALKTLQDKRMIERFTMVDERDEWLAYKLTSLGWAWTINNKNIFVLKSAPKFGKKNNNYNVDDDFPF
jgi:nucleoside 2-deoxyribosyltransferase